MLRCLRQTKFKGSLAAPRALYAPHYNSLARCSGTTVATSVLSKTALAKPPIRRSFGSSHSQTSKKSYPLNPSQWDPKELRDFQRHTRGYSERFALYWFFALFMLSHYLKDLAPLTGRIRFLTPLPMLRGPAVNDPEQAVQSPDAEILPDDDPRVGRLQDVAARMTYAAGLEREDWTVELLDNEESACSIIASTHCVIMTTGLLNAAESDAALAFILGRELGRVVARHDVDLARPMAISMFLVLNTWPFFRYLLHLAWHGATATPGPATVLAAGGFLLLLDDWVVVSNSLCQERREEEADYISLVLMTSAGYNPEQLDTFVPATRSSNWRCTNERYGRILQGVVQRHVKSDIQRVERLVGLVPTVREMVETNNGASRVRDFQPQSVPHVWRNACWDKFVKERESNRARGASSS